MGNHNKNQRKELDDVQLSEFMIPYLRDRDLIRLAAVNNYVSLLDHIIIPE